MESATVRALVIVKGAQEKLNHLGIGMNRNARVQTEASKGKSRREVEKCNEMAEGL